MYIRKKTEGATNMSGKHPIASRHPSKSLPTAFVTAPNEKVGYPTNR